MAPWWLAIESDDSDPDAAAPAPAPARAERAASVSPARRERRGRRVAEARREAPAKPRTAPRDAPSRKRAEERSPPRRDESRRDEPRRDEPRREEAQRDEDLVFTRLPEPAVSERPTPYADERKIAMFVDLENVVLGVRDSQLRKFDIDLVMTRLLEKGKLIAKKAYADWHRYSDYKRPFHEAAIELIDIPQKHYSGKNSADIKMVVDAMDLCYSKDHVDTFVIVSGDSDFSPLVSKLKENDKYVIGLGVKRSTSQLLIANCDEFIYYEDLWRDAQSTPRLDHVEGKDAEVFELLTEAMLALIRENKEILWGSMIKQTMKRKRPSFNEGYYGYGSFTELLEDAQAKGVIRLKRDARSGNYAVTGFARRG